MINTILECLSMSEGNDSEYVVGMLKETLEAVKDELEEVIRKNEAFGVEYYQLDSETIINNINEAISVAECNENAAETLKEALADVYEELEDHRVIVCNNIAQLFDTQEKVDTWEKFCEDVNFHTMDVAASLLSLLSEEADYTQLCNHKNLVKNTDEWQKIQKLCSVCEIRGKKFAENNKKENNKKK